MALNENVQVGDANHAQLHTDVNKKVNLLDLDVQSIKTSGSGLASTMATAFDSQQVDTLIGVNADNTTYEYARIRESYLNNLIDQRLAGTSNTGASGLITNYPFAPTSHSFQFLNKQTFTAPPTALASDLEYAVRPANPATPLTFGPYSSVLDAGGVQPRGKYLARVKAVAATDTSPARAASAVVQSQTFLDPANTVNAFLHNSKLDYYNVVNGAMSSATEQAPDGSNTAAKIICFNYPTMGFAKDGSMSSFSDTMTNGAIYCTSIFAKPKDVSVVNSMRIANNDGRYDASFEFASGKLYPTNNVISCNVQDVSSLGGLWTGWYLCEVVYQLIGNATIFNFTFNNTAVGDVYIWAPQINPGTYRKATVLTT